jgi:catechol 2,3-dioxygenase-like lactoylglutathione lyase family enzyme
VQDAIPVCYVRDLDAAQSFYQVLGLSELRRGGSDRGGYRFLGAGDCTLLLVRVDPCPVTVPLPLGLYLWSTDVAAVQAALTEAGVACEDVGQSEHAPGGEVRTADPDGNVVVLGQRAASTSTGSGPGGAAARGAGFSILKEAAARVAERGDAPAVCEIGQQGGTACPQPAEVKLADPWGTTVWGCLPHAEEALLNARSAFVAVDDGQGLTPWLQHRRQPRSND